MEKRREKLKLHDLAQAKERNRMEKAIPYLQLKFSIQNEGVCASVAQ